MIARQSRLFIPTLRDPPADAVAVSHRLLVRAGFVRQLAAGLYSYLPLGKRVLNKVEAIVRAEMDAVGAQECYFPALHPAEVWRQSGRWEVMGEDMFRLTDRKGGEYCLGMTHEEIFAGVARDELRSYRQLPQVWYQIQTKFRDEPRPKSGLIRVRQFTMKDAYSFDVDVAGLDRAYADQRGAYERIFRRCGLEFALVEAHSGTMGGRESAEFVVRAEAGEDQIATCRRCGYAANLETARSRIPVESDEESGNAEPRRFPTPGVLTIEALAAPPHGIPARRQLKTLVYVADGRPIVAVVRGDHQLNEPKLQSAVGTANVRPAHPEEIGPLMGAQPGSLGAVARGDLTVLVDHAVVDRVNMVTGANVDGFHLDGVDVRRDVLGHGARAADLRTVAEGEGCPECDGTLEVFKALEVGHIFKLGTRFSEAVGATVLTPEGQPVPIVMGSYGIGLDRIVAAAVELGSDEAGIVWPPSIAPYHASVLALGAEAAVLEAAERVAADLAAAGLEVLLDDREERPGVKFKDADLIGLPLRVAIGARSLAAGGAEWKLRREASAQTVPLDEIAERASKLAREWDRGPRDLSS
jgi:prolyl-tRNA synthetase